MKTSSILAAFAAFCSTSVLAAPTENVDLVDGADDFTIYERANLPGLNAVQTRNARAIIAEAKKEKVGQHGCEAAIATGMTESSLRILANKKVPASTKYKHDGFGSDHDSVGIFQQRAMYYKNIKCDMQAGCSAKQFFSGMKAVKGWKTMDVAKLCQRVQRSAYPDAYKKWTATAKKVCKAGL